MNDLTFVVPFRSDDGPRKKIFDWTHERLSLLFRNSPIIVCDNEGDFNLAAARNNGLRQVETEFVASLDADTIWDKQIVEDAIDALLTDSPWVIPYTTYAAIDAPSAEIVLSQAPAHPVWSMSLQYEYAVSVDPEQMFQPESGIIVMRTEDMFRVGGFDERCQGWGWEDRIFRQCADTILGRHTRPEYATVYHIWHPRGPEATVAQPHYHKNWELYNQHVHNFHQVHQRFL